jgi:hypothetical protein
MCTFLYSDRHFSLLRSSLSMHHAYIARYSPDNSNTTPAGKPRLTNITSHHHLHVHTAGNNCVSSAYVPPDTNNTPLAGVTQAETHYQPPIPLLLLLLLLLLTTPLATTASATHTSLQTPTTLH